MKEPEKVLYQHITETMTRLAVIDQKLDTIVKSTAETNGRVHKLEIQVSNLERETKDRDENLEVLISKSEIGIRAWVWKVIAISALVGSFVWIEEARTFIIKVLTAIL